METWATFSIIDHLKSIGDQTQEELAQLEAVDYLREAQAGEARIWRFYSFHGVPRHGDSRSKALQPYTVVI
jgi:hypothetical protein